MEFSHVHRGSPGNVESTNLSVETLSREIGCRLAVLQSARPGLRHCSYCTEHLCQYADILASVVLCVYTHISFISCFSLLCLGTSLIFVHVYGYVFYMLV